MAVDSKTVTIRARYGMRGGSGPLVVFHRYGQEARIYQNATYASRYRIVKVARERATQGHGAIGLRVDGWYYTDFRIPMFADPRGRVLII